VTLELARPAALVALLLPVAVLLASRIHDRPEEAATGTLALWERIASRYPISAGSRRRRIPPAVWMLALGLALGSLALAGPRRPVAVEARSFRALVDASPSMGLPLESGTRRDRAIAAAKRWLEEAQPGAKVEWIDRSPPFGAEDDEPDVLWVTDRAPSPAPKRAGFFASGGPAVPGPIAVEGTTRYDWDGTRIVAVSNGAPPRRAEVRGGIPPTIARVVEAWAGARGVKLASKGADRPVLVVRGADPDSREALAAFEAGRDGWTAKGTAIGAAPSADADGPLETWLADAGGRALVTTGAGRVHCPWISLDEPRGDRAAFAVSWAALLDRASLDPIGVVELLERADAGAALSRPPSLDASASSRSPGLLSAGFAASAFLCVLAAWVLSSARVVE
jgi:hypothetical protein